MSCDENAKCNLFCSIYYLSTERNGPHPIHPNRNQPLIRDRRGRFAPKTTHDLKKCVENASFLNGGADAENVDDDSSQNSSQPQSSTSQVNPFQHPTQIGHGSGAGVKPSPFPSNDNYTPGKCASIIVLGEFPQSADEEEISQEISLLQDKVHHRDIFTARQVIR